MFYKHSRWLSVAIIGFLIVLVLGAYFKVFRAEFVYDDLGFIVNNKDIQSFRPISKFFLSPDIFTGSNYVSDAGGGKNWRPIASLAFAVEYAMFGNNPSGFHSISIILHILNLVFVYFLVARLTGRIGIAALTAAFWALHPASTEAVSWVSNQSSLLFLNFFILAVFAILNYQQNKNKKFWIWISCLFFILSLLAKETALGGIFIIPFIFLLDSQWREKINFRRILAVFFPFILIGLAYFYAHYKILGALGDRTPRGSFFESLLLTPTIFYKYVITSVYPVNLLLDYADFPLPRSIFDPRVILGILFFSILMVFLYVGLKKSWLVFSFGIAWFLAFLSPVMQVIPFHDLIGERFLYAPILGFFLSAVLGMERLLSYVKFKFDWNFYPAGKAAATLALGSFLILTLNRNKDWLNSENLWNSVLKVDSKNEKALANLGAYYIDKKMAPEVIEVSEKLIRINGNSAFGNINYGVGLAMAGRLEEAEKRFLFILSKKPNYQPALMNLAAVYQNTGRYNKALEILHKLIINRPSDDDLKKRISQLENITKYNESPSVISAYGEGQHPYIETELQAPAVEGNIVNSGIAGRVVLADGAPFEANLDIFKSDHLAEPFISVRSDSQGKFQVPLKPATYIVKPSSPYASHLPLRDQYEITVGNGRWLQVKIEYK